MVLTLLYIGLDSQILWVQLSKFKWKSPPESLYNTESNKNLYGIGEGTYSLVLPLL